MAQKPYEGDRNDQAASVAIRSGVPGAPQPREVNFFAMQNPMLVCEVIHTNNVSGLQARTKHVDL
jgi:hypothetical protein